MGGEQIAFVFLFPDQEPGTTGFANLESAIHDLLEEDTLVCDRDYCLADVYDGGQPLDLTLKFLVDFIYFEVQSPAIMHVMDPA